MKKLAISLLLLLVTLSVGCSQKSLPEPFTKDNVAEASKQVISVFTANNRQTFFDMCSNDLKAALTNNDLDAAKAQVMPEAGTLNKVETKSVTAAKDNSGNDIAVAMTIAEYENQKVTYTICFDKNMEICGFYLK